MWIICQLRGSELSLRHLCSVNLWIYLGLLLLNGQYDTELKYSGFELEG